MAGLVHPTPKFGFHPAPVNHSPSPLGFGFGLTSSHAAWQSQPSPAAFLAPSTSFSSHSKSTQKRRHDDVEDELRDESMDRSPTPERTVRRIIPKRARVSAEQPPQGSQNEASKNTKDFQHPSSKPSDGVDVGMLLASLPPQSLLPILSSLLAAHPSLKDNVLSLIPRPTLETAVQALNHAVKKLRDAYPYSTSTSTHATFGFGSNQFGTNRTNWGQSPSRSASSQSSTSGMRDSYVISRLRPHISDYVATACSYMPYFSFRENASQSQQARMGKDPAVAHPTETFAYLSTLTNHLVTQPQLSQQLLSTELMARIIEEWLAWVAKVDAYVNKEGGMFGMEVVKGWERSLDEFANAKIHNTNGELDAGLKTVRDKWVAHVGWLVGRDGSHHAMEDEEEL